MADKKWVIKAQVFRNKEMKILERIPEFCAGRDEFDEENTYLTMGTPKKMSLFRAICVYMKLSKLNLYSMMYKDKSER